MAGSGDLAVISLAPLREPTPDGERLASLATQIDRACREVGFFSVVDHGVPAEVPATLDAAARRFFALDEPTKARIAMALGGGAWRGWFPLGGELTSGAADHKEGLYFGQELGREDPRVQAGLPLHGPNQFPDEPAELRPAVLAYLSAVTEAAQLVLVGLALALGLPAGWFREHLTAEPLVLLRVFAYPPVPGPGGWGVGEHTDYGLVTLLHQDASGGLEVRRDGRWEPVDPVPDAFVVNLGDMVERMTQGTYRSTPHRVRSPAEGTRISIPLFLDPGWDVRVPVLAEGPGAPGSPAAWDGTDVHAFDGTYGDYVTAKVAKVFPSLGGTVL